MSQSKFYKQLTLGGKGIIATRAAIIVEDVKSEQEALVRALEAEKRKLERELLKLEDMGPDSDISLRVVKDAFSATSWVAQYQAVKVSLKKKEEELAIAKETFTTWFGELSE